MVNILKKFYKPFVMTYILLSVGLGFYPTFNFFSFNGQLVLIGVSIINGLMGIYLKKL